MTAVLLSESLTSGIFSACSIDEAICKYVCNRRILRHEKNARVTVASVVSLSMDLKVQKEGCCICPSAGLIESLELWSR